MDRAIRALMHQLMTDRKHKTKAQQAMVYGHTTQRMDFQQFSSYMNANALEKASSFELYTLLVLFYETSKNASYDPQKYFTPEEIASFQNRQNFQRYEFPLLATLSEGEYLSIIPLRQAVQLVKQMLDAQAGEKYQATRLFYLTGNSISYTATEIKQRMKSDLYYPNLFWINIVEDEITMPTSRTISIPLEIPSYRLIVDNDLVQAIGEVDNIDEFVNTLSSKRMIPLRITHLSGSKVGRMGYSNLRKM